MDDTPHVEEALIELRYDSCAAYTVSLGLGTPPFLTPLPARALAHTAGTPGKTASKASCTLDLAAHPSSRSVDVRALGGRTTDSPPNLDPELAPGS